MIENTSKPESEQNRPDAALNARGRDPEKCPGITPQTNDLSAHSIGRENLLMNPIKTRVSEMLEIDYPIFCGAMFPCSNPELILAVSKAGGMGVIQPVSFEKVHNWDYREALQYIKQNTDKPFGVNIIVRNFEKRYQQAMENYVQISLEEGCKFFVTSLGDPSWVVKAGQKYGDVKVFHKVVNLRHAKKAVAAKVDGLILVNDRAGGHLGDLTAETLIEQFKKEFGDPGIPLVLAGGVGGEKDFSRALQLGYEGVLMGTRFIATEECNTPENYKKSLLEATEADLVLTSRVDGVKLSVINNDFVKSVGLKQPLYMRLARRLAAISPVFKPVEKWATALNIALGMKHVAKSAKRGDSSRDYFQAGASVTEVKEIEPAGAIIERFVKHYNKEHPSS